MTDRNSDLVPSSQPETPTETTLRAALRRIADGGDCQCEDHTSKDCCAAVEDFCCPLCIAERALIALPVVQDEAPKADAIEALRQIRAELWDRVGPTPDLSPLYEIVEAALGASRPSPTLSLVDQSTLDRIDASLTGVNGLAPHITIEDARFLRALVGRPSPADRKEPK